MTHSNTRQGKKRSHKQGRGGKEIVGRFAGFSRTQVFSRTRRTAVTPTTPRHARHHEDCRGRPLRRPPAVGVAVERHRQEGLERLAVVRHDLVVGVAGRLVPKVLAAARGAPAERRHRRLAEAQPRLELEELLVQCLAPPHAALAGGGVAQLRIVDQPQLAQLGPPVADLLRVEDLDSRSSSSRTT